MDPAADPGGDQPAGGGLRAEGTVVRGKTVRLGYLRRRFWFGRDDASELRFDK